MADLCVTQAGLDIFGDCAPYRNRVCNLRALPQEAHQAGSRFSGQCHTSKPNLSSFFQSLFFFVMKLCQIKALFPFDNHQFFSYHFMKFYICAYLNRSGYAHARFLTLLKTTDILYL